MMTNRMILGVAMLGLSVAAPAFAQFKLDEAPSAQRAQNAKDMAGANNNGERLQDRARRRGIQPLSSIGESQSVSQTLQPMTAATALQADAGVVADTAPAVGPDGKPLPPDPSIDDPNKPRQPLKPKSLKSGVAPR